MNQTAMRGGRDERLTILCESEKNALYGLPVFDDFQRVEFFAMTNTERSLALQRRGLLKQVYCLLQIGYFKAKQAFFQFSLDEVSPEDVAFLLQRYFPTHNTLIAEPLSTKNITRNVEKLLFYLIIVFGLTMICQH